MAPITTYRAGEVADLLGVSIDTVRRWSDTGRLRSTRSDGGQRLIDGADLARFLRERADAAVDRDGHSARNRLPGIVTAVTRDKVAAQVEIQSGPFRIVALVTREAVDELGLQPGSRASAVVKATNVSVALP